MSTNSSLKRSLRDRDTRQRDLVPPDRLAACQAVVIGVGAIGRQVALQMAAMGVSRLTLIDHDQVGIENLAPQGYWPSDLNEPKVDATAAVCLQINPDLGLRRFAERFRRSLVREVIVGSNLVVVCCVDSIGTRRLIWESVRSRATLFLDGRMNAEVIRILAVDRPGSDAYYATTLFAEAEAFAGSCTAKSTIYTASIAAGLMLGQFTRWLRNLPVEADVLFNSLAMDLTVSAPPRRDSA